MTLVVCRGADSIMPLVVCRRADTSMPLVVCRVADTIMPLVVCMRADTIMPLVVCRRAHVLFTLFVFAYVQWCLTHIVLCFCFVFSSSCLPYVASFSEFSIFDCPFGIL
jgi:hypothetical protein